MAISRKVWGGWGGLWEMDACPLLSQEDGIGMFCRPVYVYTLNWPFLSTCSGLESSKESHIVRNILERSKLKKVFSYWTIFLPHKGFKWATLGPERGSGAAGVVRLFKLQSECCSHRYLLSDFSMPGIAPASEHVAVRKMNGDLVELFQRLPKLRLLKNMYLLGLWFSWVAGNKGQDPSWELSWKFFIWS